MIIIYVIIIYANKELLYINYYSLIFPYNFNSPSFYFPLKLLSINFPPENQINSFRVRYPYRHKSMKRALDSRLSGSKQAED